ncbi:HSP20-like chaperone [Leptodontidium sp. MPI-SDFR-AT-0119]|nr:HSP20-like chaperone [Leptodontidium sp. MPI-SDFR-AT-0119]
MSPFTQLQTALGHNYGYGNGIDKDFSPILHYIDEFDRHFSSRHRFMNCFIPRFDLEEDDWNYYLYGDIPGATVSDITVEANDERTLVVYGNTKRPGPEREGEVKGEGVSNPTPGFQASSLREQEKQTSEPSPPIQPAPALTHHQRHLTSDSDPNPNPNPTTNHVILLSERLTGDFHRTFAFPRAVNEKGVKASMENGVLSVVVPKRHAAEEERKKGNKIPILKGGWWREENGLHGENEARGRMATKVGGEGMDQGNAVGFGGGAV